MICISNTQWKTNQKLFWKSWIKFKTDLSSAIHTKKSSFWEKSKSWSKSSILLEESWINFRIFCCFSVSNQKSSCKLAKNFSWPIFAYLSIRFHRSWALSQAISCKKALIIFLLLIWKHTESWILTAAKTSVKVLPNTAIISAS